MQSNQFPRAVDLARQFRAAGLPVCIGGFHVSGCIAMLPELPSDMRAAQALGISLFAGEAEKRRLDEVLRDAWSGEADAALQLHGRVCPRSRASRPRSCRRSTCARTSGSLSSIDLGRGCPYQCSFCTIINVQGRKSRFRSPDDLERIVRLNYAQGIKRFFITDDNFARNKHWEPLLDRMIELRGGRPQHRLHHPGRHALPQIPNFIEKATQAGVRRVFIGLENINPDNLMAANKRQNKITEYRIMLQKWREHGAITYAGYILGFPGDTKESIKRDIEIIKRELPLDILEFFFLTPLPGSEDHKVPLAEGRLDGPRHEQIRPQPPGRASCQDVGRRMGGGLPGRLGDLLHARAHPHDPAPRRRQSDRPAEDDVTTILWFYLAFKHEGVHPLEGGVFRLKFRARPPCGLPARSPFVFYPRYVGETLVKAWPIRALVEHRRILKEVSRPRPTAGPIPTSRSRRRATTSSRRSISITRPPAARPRSRARSRRQHPCVGQRRNEVRRCRRGR